MTRPLFGQNNSLVHKIYDTPYAGNSNAYFIDHVFLYNFLYFAVNGNGWKIYKASGTPTNIKIRLALDLNEQQRRIGNTYGPLGPVHRLNSLFNYCFYLSTGEDS